MAGGNPERYVGSQSTRDGESPTRYLLVPVGPDTFDANIFPRITQSEQAASGAMVRLNDTTLTGESATQDINGDASFAIGRWVTGTVTSGSSKNEVLTGNGTRTYHYLAFNEIPNIPPDGTPPLTCGGGVFTTPTYLDSGPNDAPISGTATGSATISFDRDGANINGAIKVTAGGGEGTVRIVTSYGFNSPSSMVMSVINMDNVAGKWTASYMLGDGGSNGTMMIAVRYIAVMLPSGARYTGLAKLNCAPQPQ